MLSASTVWPSTVAICHVHWTPIVWPDKVDSRPMALLESSWPLSLYISELLRHHRNLWTDSYQAAVAFSLSSVQTVIVELPNMHHASQSPLQYIFILLHYSSRDQSTGGIYI